MTNTVYTFGYLERKPEDLSFIASQHKAVIFDIRFSPYSRLWQFNSSALKTILKDRYKWVRAFGNAAYKETPARIQIADFEKGLAEIQASPIPVMLMCACRRPEECHRTVVGAMLRERGFEVTELPIVPTKTELKKAALENLQPRLFS